jgi:DNA-binding winged helix-turn-helix (wHTH) protein
VTSGPEPPPKARIYRFGEFTLLPGQRVLLRRDRELPLIPRYLDLLILLIDRRHEAVHRREIFESVWSDVVVSDGALSQAIRTLRRTLGDDPREPVFIRTVSRHGYRFVFDGVVIDGDNPSLGGAAAEDEKPKGDSFESALARLLARGPEAEGPDGDDRREAAETLHILGTVEALRRLDERKGHEEARALLRDARWDVPGAGPVPLWGRTGGWKAMRILMGLRLGRAIRIVQSRWASASGGGAAAGLAAGFLGGVALCLASQTSWRVPVALALIAAIIGGVGAAGVGAGLALAEALARSSRGLALVALGATGGALVGAIAHMLGRWTLEGLFGRELLDVGGGLEGLVIGGSCGLGYALATPRKGGGMAAPRGSRRIVTAALTGLACASGCVGLALMGGHSAGMSLDFIARSFQGSQVGLAPLARLLGEPSLGPLTRTALSAYEGAFFGFGLAWGLTRRPPEDVTKRRG